MEVKCFRYTRNSVHHVNLHHLSKKFKTETQFKWLSGDSLLIFNYRVVPAALHTLPLADFWYKYGDNYDAETITLAISAYNFTTLIMTITTSCSPHSGYGVKQSLPTVYKIPNSLQSLNQSLGLPFQFFPELLFGFKKCLKQLQIAKYFGQGLIQSI